MQRREEEVTALKETNQNLLHQLAAAQTRISTVESDLNVANATLMERTNQLTTIQRELDQRRNTQDNMDMSFRKDRVGVYTCT